LFQAQFCLQPTYEEAVTEIVANAGQQPVGRFPVMLYQLNEKFRDEQSPRLGLLRSRSFIMKDLYSFDLNENDAHITYERVTNAYWQIFNRRLGLRTYRVRATSGMFGGTCSHEFHLENPLGQDTILLCSKCNSGVNAEVLPEAARHSESHSCEHCNAPTEKLRTIEVGHTFALGTKYSDAFGAAHDARPLQMCCFGIGVSRLLAAAVDALSPTDTQLRLPAAIAPFKAVVVLPKSGSRQEIATPFVLDVADALSQLPELAVDADVLVDDRTNLTIGRRVADAVKLGVPWIVIGGKATAESMTALGGGEGAPTLLEVERTIPSRRDAQPQGTMTHAELASTLIRQLGENVALKETDRRSAPVLIR
uniref:proline--tRNA ligase n=1 Tax=Plectus sambesii TaxID=2011161 RepID=A0A914V7X1_9BILA